MTKEKNPKKKKCVKNRKAMLTYGFIQLSSSIISALALTAIALNLSTIKKEATVFNECIQEVKNNKSNTSNAVRFCNGGS